MSCFRQFLLISSVIMSVSPVLASDQPVQKNGLASCISCIQQEGPVIQQITWDAIQNFTKDAQAIKAEIPVIKGLIDDFQEKGNLKAERPAVGGWQRFLNGMTNCITCVHEAQPVVQQTVIDAINGFGAAAGALEKQMPAIIGLINAFHTNSPVPVSSGALKTRQTVGHFQGFLNGMTNCINCVAQEGPVVEKSVLDAISAAGAIAQELQNELPAIMASVNALSGGGALKMQAEPPARRGLLRGVRNGLTNCITCVAQEEPVVQQTIMEVITGFGDAAGALQQQLPVIIHLINEIEGKTPVVPAEPVFNPSPAPANLPVDAMEIDHT